MKRNRRIRQDYSRLATNYETTASFVLVHYSTELYCLIWSNDIRRGSDNKIGNQPRISTLFDLNIQNVTFPTVKIFAGVSHRDIALVARVACLEILAFCNIDSVLAAYISICVIRGCWIFRLVNVSSNASVVSVTVHRENYEILL